MRNFRILHTEASCGWGGQEIRILDEAQGLIARGYDVQLATPMIAPIADEAARRGINLHRLPIDRRRFTSLRALLRLINRIAPQVIVTHSSTDSWLVSIATRLTRPRPAVIRTRHISAPVKPNVFNRWLYGRVPVCVVTTGEALRENLIAGLRLDPARVISIPTGVDLDRFRPGDQVAARRQLGLPGGDIVGIVATLRSWKGHRFLLSAMTDVRLLHACLVVVGDGPQKEVLEELTVDLGLSDRVVFAGQQENVVPWIQAFDVFALPSTANEGVPQALAQAMACGIPTVTTPVGATLELVEDGQTGLVVPSEDNKALAKAIARLLDDGSLAASISATGRRHIAKKYAAASMLDAVENMLLEFAGADCHHACRRA